MTSTSHPQKRKRLFEDDISESEADEDDDNDEPLFFCMPPKKKYRPRHPYLDVSAAESGGESNDSDEDDDEDDGSFIDDDVTNDSTDLSTYRRLTQRLNPADEERRVVNRRRKISVESKQSKSDRYDSEDSFIDDGEVVVNGSGPEEEEEIPYNNQGEQSIVESHKDGEGDHTTGSLHGRSVFNGFNMW